MTRARDLADYIAQGVSTTELDILDGLTTTTAELNILDGVTATTAELNIVDGVTSTAAELNILDGVTSTAAELNILDGVTSTAAELNILDGVTATATELNLIDGVTSTTDELNILDGVTATATELNLLDGVTSTTAELNILDGVTSTTAELNYNDTGAAVGTVVASKTVTVDANKDASSFRNITMAGDLSIGGDVITASNANLDLAPHGTGTVVVRGNTNSGAVVFNCESNSHGQKVYGQPHSATVTNTLMLPAGANSTLLSRVSVDTLTNKTLTSPKVNEDVAVTSTATELNILDGVTATTAELNILDGVTSTATELNILDGVTATTAELNYLDVATLGTSAASKVVTADSDGVVIFAGTIDIEEVYEKVSTFTSTSGTITFDTVAQGIMYGTANAAANRTINFTNVNANLSAGQSVTAAVLLTQGSTAYYLNTIQVDGASVTPKFAGGTAFDAGNESGIDSYSFTIIKTADATFTVLASQTQFA